MLRKFFITYQLLLQKNALLSSAFKRHKIKEDNIIALYDQIFKNASTSEVITLENIGKVYDNGYKAVHNFNLEIKPGEFISFLGPSGCGKTTILRMIAGLEYISEGILKQGDLVLNSALPQERSLSMVFQNYGLYPYMDVFNNIAFGLKIGIFNNEISKKLFNEYKFLKNPFINEKKYLKNQNKSLKKPFQEQILQKKKEIILEKSSINRNEEYLLELKIHLKKLHQKSKELVNDNKKQIVVNKKRLVELKSEYKIFKNEESKKKRTQKQKNKELALKEDLPGQLTKIKANKQKEINNKKLEIKQKIINFKKEIKVQEAKINNEKNDLKTKINELKQDLTKNIDQIKQDNNLKIKVKSLKIAFKKAKKDLLKEIQTLESDFIITKTRMLDQKFSYHHELKEFKKKFKTQEFILKDKYSYSSPLTIKYREYLESLAVWKYSIRERVINFSTMVGIEKYLKRKPAALSGGQRQRIALVRAISKNVKLFLFDEPLSNLDAKLRSSMRSEIKALHNQLGTTSIFVTHDQIEATTMSDRIVLLNKGYIQQIGTPEELFFAPANIFVADFIGSPQINLIEAFLINSKNLKIGQKLINYASRQKIEVNKKQKVIVGIRPQEIIFDQDILNQGNKANIFEGIIKQIENIGHERKIILKIKNLEKNFVVVTANKYLDLAVDKKIKFYLNPSRIHIFDYQSGVSLSSKINDETKKALNLWQKSVNQRIKNMILLDAEKDKEKISQKVVKDVTGLVIPAFGRKRKLAKINKKVKKYEDVSPIKIDEQVGN